MRGQHLSVLILIIPATVQITTASLSGPIFLTQSVTLPANQSIQYFSANSMDAGSASNTPAATFSRHNFTGYTDFRFGSLLVTNNTGITGGRDQEDDTSYQYRIHLKLISHSSCNEDALRSQLLPIPGIQNVAFDSKAGTFYCYVYAITPLASLSLLQTVQDAIDQNVAFPLSGTALNPDLVGISLATSISLNSSTSQTDQQTAIANATQAVQNYINNLAIGQALVINDIADRIINSSSLCRRSRCICLNTPGIAG